MDESVCAVIASESGADEDEVLPSGPVQSAPAPWVSSP